MSFHIKNQISAKWGNNLVKLAVAQDLRLKTKNCYLQFKGEAHKTQGDGWRATGQIFTTNGTRITSVHAYSNGEVIFSKKEYPRQYHPINAESAAQLASGPSAHTVQWVPLATGGIVATVDGHPLATYYDKANKNYYYVRNEVKFYYRGQ